MNSFTNTVLTLLLGWLRALLNAARDFISSDTSTAFFAFFRDNWRVLFLILCIVGFVLDQIVYLIRWRPRPVWLRRRAKRILYNPPPQEAYDPAAFDADMSALPTTEYAPATAYDYEDISSAPTMQYQMPQGSRAMDTRPVVSAYSPPYYTPAAMPGGDSDEAPLRWDELTQGHTFAPEEDQRAFAFGMAPSFGSAQSEPAYYHRDAAPSFAPPQYVQDNAADQYYAPQSAPEQYAGEAEAQSYQPPNPYFRPFSDRDGQTFSPPRARGFGAVAKRARTLLNADEAHESLSYRDVYPTVDVSKAFHSPVYPEKKPEGDQ